VAWPNSPIGDRRHVVWWRGPDRREWPFVPAFLAVGDEAENKTIRRAGKLGPLTPSDFILDLIIWPDDRFAP
jgi:hypothetical protein